MKDNENKKSKKETFSKASKGGDIDSRESSTHYPSDSVQATPLEVKVFGNNFERALKAFRALIQKERVLSSYKDKQTYEKPSDRKRRKHNESKRKSMDECTKGNYTHASDKQSAKPPR